jgi:hypothetical protein
LPVANGGTGAATLTGYVKASGTTVMTASATVPVGDISGTLPVANGGTNLSSYTTGDILYASGTTALAKLSAVAAGSVLLSGTTPSYGKVILTTGSTQHVTGTLPVANGGTGAATLTGYVKASGTTAMTAIATIPVTDGGTGVTQSAYGEYYLGVTPTATVITTTGQYEKVAGNTVEGTLSNFTHPSSNRLTYTGTATRKFFVSAALAFHGDSTDEYNFVIYKSGVEVGSSSISVTGKGTNDLAHVSSQCIVDLTNTNYIEVFVTNTSTVADLTVDFMNVTAIALI